MKVKVEDVYGHPRLVDTSVNWDVQDRRLKVKMCHLVRNKQCMSVLFMIAGSHFLCICAKERRSLELKFKLLFKNDGGVSNLESDGKSLGPRGSAECLRAG